MSKKDLKDNNKVKTTKHGTAKKISALVVLAAVAILGYKLWENPKLLYQLRDMMTQAEQKEDVYQTQIDTLQQQLNLLQGQLAEVAMKAENPDFSAMNKRIDDIEQLNINTIKSKANVDTVLGLVVRMDNAEGKIDDLSKVTDNGALILTAAMLVKDAGMRGGKFIYEAEVLSELAAGNYKIAKEVARLNEIAVVGVPNLDELQTEFAKVYVAKYRIEKKEDGTEAKENEFSEEDRAWSVVRDLVLDSEISKAIAIIDKPLNAPLQKDEMLEEWKKKAEIYRDFYDDIARISANALAVMKVKFLQGKN